MDTQTKHAGGRPLRFDTVDAFQVEADKYFKDTPKGERTITGLAVALNTSRETLMNYQERDEYFDAIKAAKDKIELDYEQTLRSRGSAGDIFGLKNFGWKDKTEVDSTFQGDITSNGQTIGAVDPALAAKFAEFTKAETAG